MRRSGVAGGAGPHRALVVVRGRCFPRPGGCLRQCQKAREALSCRTRRPPAKPPGSAGAGRQAASPSQSKRLRLGFHKLSLPCLFRVLPVIREKSQEELKQPRPPAQPRLHLPACVPQPSGTVCPRDLPALRHVSGSGPGQKRRQELPTVPALPPCPSPRRLTPPVWCVPALQGTGSLRTERAEKRLRLLMASKRQEVEADVWRQYHASRAGRNTERGQVWHALPSPQEKGISPSRSPGGEQGRSPGTGTAAVLWPAGQAGAFCLPAALHVALQEELSLRPQAEACSRLWHGRSVVCPYLSTRAQHHRPEDCASHAPGLKPWEQPQQVVAGL